MDPQREKNHFAKSKNITTNFSEFDAIMAFIGWKAKLTSFEMPCSSRQETSFVGLHLQQPADSTDLLFGRKYSREHCPTKALFPITLLASYDLRTPEGGNSLTSDAVCSRFSLALPPAQPVDLGKRGTLPTFFFLYAH